MSEPSSDRRLELYSKAYKMRERFALLLDQHSMLASRNRAAHVPYAAQIESLLNEFRQIRKATESGELAQAANELERIPALLAGYNGAVQQYRLQQEQDADDFNILAVLQLTGKEVRHSMVLAWLLDHDMRKLGTHAQGNLGFQLFLEEFRLPSHYAERTYWVRREVPGDISIVDVEIACRGQFLIHIENKIWSGEGNDQSNREWSDLLRRADYLSVKPDRIHAFFLTPNGRKATNPNFRAISWGRIARILEHFAEQVKPMDVKLFAAHYARTVRRFIAIQDIGGDDYAEKLDE